MKTIEARNLRVGTLITSIQGDYHDAKPITHIYPNQESGWVWVRMVGVYNETHYDVRYRLTPYEQVTVIETDNRPEMGQGDMIHPKLRKAAEDWVEDAFNPGAAEMRRIRRMPDRHLRNAINRAWDGGWGDFVSSNTINGEYV